nr:hypothetical protein CFP56_02597 [Quercus suber]
MSGSGKALPSRHKESADRESYQRPIHTCGVCGLIHPLPSCSIPAGSSTTQSNQAMPGAAESFRPTNITWSPSRTTPTVPLPPSTVDYGPIRIQPPGSPRIPPRNPLRSMTAGTHAPIAQPGITPTDGAQPRQPFELLQAPESAQTWEQYHDAERVYGHSEYVIWRSWCRYRGLEHGNK